MSLAFTSCFTRSFHRAHCDILIINDQASTDGVPFVLFYIQSPFLQNKSFAQYDLQALDLQDTPTTLFPCTSATRYIQVDRLLPEKRWIGLHKTITGQGLSGFFEIDRFDFKYTETFPTENRLSIMKLPITMKRRGQLSVGLANSTRWMGTVCWIYLPPGKSTYHSEFMASRIVTS